MRMVGAMMGLETTGDEKLYVSVSGYRYLLNASDLLDQTGHNHFEDHEGLSARFLCFFCWTEPIFILVWLVPHAHLHYLMVEKN